MAEEGSTSDGVSGNTEVTFKEAHTALEQCDPGCQHVMGMIRHGTSGIAPLTIGSLLLWRRCI